MIAIRSIEVRVAAMERNQPPRLMLSSVAALVAVQGSVMLTRAAMRSNCQRMRPMSSRPSGPSFGMVP